jgi:putative selenium-binding protein YdfZ
MVNTFTYDRYRNRIGQGTRVMDAETGVTGIIAAFRVQNGSPEELRRENCVELVGQKGLFKPVSLMRLESTTA